MTSTSKGLYSKCLDCLFRFEEKEKYPCLKSHKEIRDSLININQKIECNLYIKNDKDIHCNKEYWTYIFGIVQLVVILDIFSIKKEILCTVKNSNGNKRNVNIEKIYKEKKDLINYLEKNKIALNIIEEYELNVCKGLEDERE
jgi:hypothetical protein